MGGTREDSSNTNAAHRSDTGGRDAADITRGRNEHERSAGQQGGSRTAQGVPQENATRHDRDGSDVERRG
jgi:hypothetical protein